MREKLLPIIVALCFCQVGFGQSYSLGVSAVERYDFYGAQRMFRALEYTCPLEHRVGEVAVFVNDKSPFRSLDSALFYLNRARSSVKYSDCIDSAVLSDLDSLEKTLEQEMLIGIDTMSVRRVNDLLFNFSQIANRQELLSLRDSLAYVDLLKSPTWVNAQMFQLAYPNSSFMNSVTYIYDSSYYVDHTRGYGVEELLAYQKDHPDSPYLLDIDDRVYGLFIDGSQDIDVYYAFVDSFPENRNYREAWQYILDEYLRVDPTSERLVAFQVAYPNFPFMEVLNQKKTLLGTKLLPVKSGDLWGYATTLGELIVDYQFDWAGFFGDGLAPVLVEDDLLFINKEGKVMIDMGLVDGASFIAKHAIVETDNGVGVIDVLGEWIVSDTLESIERSRRGLLFLYGDEQEYIFSPETGVIGEGDEIVELNDLITLQKDSVLWVFDPRGRHVQDVVADELEDFHGSILRAEIEDEVQLYDIALNNWLGRRYEEIDVLDTVSGYAVVSNGEEYGYINAIGEVKIPLKYKLNDYPLKTFRFVDGYAKFEQRGKLGLRDKKLKKVLPAIFLQIGKFDTLIPIIKEVDKWGYCDEEADLQIPYTYGYAENFIDGKAIVRSNGKYGMIGYAGDTLLGLEYINVYRLNDLLVCQKENGWWLLDSSLQELNNIPIHRILNDNPVYLTLEMKNGKVYYWDWNKKMILRLN